MSLLRPKQASATKATIPPPGEAKPSRHSPGGGDLSFTKNVPDKPVYDVAFDELKPHQQRRKGLKASAILIQQQRNIFEPETSVTIWKKRGGR